MVLAGGEGAPGAGAGVESIGAVLGVGSLPVLAAVPPTLLAPLPQAAKLTLMSAKTLIGPAGLGAGASEDFSMGVFRVSRVTGASSFVMLSIRR